MKARIPFSDYLLMEQGDTALTCWVGGIEGNLIIVIVACDPFQAENDFLCLSRFQEND